MMFIPEGKGLLFAAVAIAIVAMVAISPKTSGDRGSVLFANISRVLRALAKGFANSVAGVLVSTGIAGRVRSGLTKVLDDAAVERIMSSFFQAVPIAGRIGAGAEGALREEAERRFPPAKYPALWAPKVPDDIRRSPVADGRLINGEEIGAYAPAFISKSHQGEAFRIAILATIVWFPLVLFAWRPASYFHFEQAPAKIVRTGSQSPEAAAILRKDHWSNQALEKAKEDARVAESKAWSGRVSEEKPAGPGSRGWLTAILAGLFVFLASFRSAMGRFLQAGAGRLLTGTKEQVVRYNYRREKQVNDYNSHSEQVKRATGYDTTPLINLGTATGAFRKRGKLDAPYEGQPMLMSLLDFNQNMLVIGGTGSGKTRSVVTPIVRNLLDIRATEKRKAAGGDANAMDISMYVTDGKAVLYHDVAKIAQEKGQFDDILVLGCDEDKGEHSVDLLDGVSPQLFSDEIKSVARQSGGENQSDSIWPDMAAEVLRNNAVVARAFDRTEWGVDWRVRHDGERPYSLVFIYQLAVDDGRMLADCIDAILWTLQNDYDRLADIANVELFDAIDYLVKTWVGMVDATRDGIKINITQALGPFASNITLRRTFASGSGVRLVSIGDLWGRIVCTNISTNTYGVAGRIINVFLKTLLMTEAVRREQKVKADLADIETRMARIAGMAQGKLSPKDLDGQRKADFAILPGAAMAISEWNRVSTKLQREQMFIIADECQTLITVDTKEGAMSDSNFWNLNRSTGCSGLLLTQSVAALEQAVGKVAAENFMNNLRTKIFLLVEDTSTTEYIKKLTGKEMRFHTYDEDIHESYDAMLMAGVIHDPVMEPEKAARAGIGPAEVSDIAFDLSSAIKPFVPAKAVKSREEQIREDDAGVPVLREGGNWQGGLSTNIDQVESAKQQARWRAEDQRRKDLSEGTQEADVFTENDFTSFGQNLAYMYVQRAGKVRQDIVRLY